MPPAPVGNGPTGLAIASLVLGLTGLAGIGSILAIVLGKKSHQERERLGFARSGMANVGVALGWVFGTLTALLILLAIALPLFISRHPAAATAFDDRGLRAAVADEDRFHFVNRTYAPLDRLLASGFDQVPGSTVTVVRADTTSYCLKDVAGAATFYFDSTTRLVSTRPCA